MTSERVVYREHPSMFRNHPVYFILCVLLSFAGIGLILFLAWWLESRSITLTVTTNRVILRKGIFSKHTNTVYHVHVNNIRVGQSFIQRVFNVGSVEILTGGHAGVEISVSGIPNPVMVKLLVDQYRGARIASATGAENLVSLQTSTT